jgi:hypothetical protein
VVAPFISRDEVSGRSLHLLEVSVLSEVPARIEVSSSRFVCLVAIDATSASGNDLAVLARKLLGSGAVYVCAWGPGCDAVHLAVDVEDVGQNPPPTLDKVVMTTSHREEPLEEAIWFTLNAAWPDDAYWEGCDSTLGLVIGNSAWARRLRAAFEDPRKFSSTWLNESANDAV